MTNEAIEAKTNYAWQRLTMLNTGDHSSAICVSKSNQLFSATWNPITNSGYLQRWSVSQQKWLTIEGKIFKNSINQMCCDTIGNIYLVGDTNANNNYVIRIYNPSSGWSEADNGYKTHINYICCDSNNNVYITGSFMNASNHYPLMQYNVTTKLWKHISYSEFTMPVSGMCIDANNNIYTLNTTTLNTTYFSYWNGTAWNSVTSPNMQQATGIGCDNSGNVYFNSITSIWSYNIASHQYTNLNAPIQIFSGLIALANFFYTDNMLYFSITGYTGAIEIESYIWVYSNDTWSDITPSNFNRNNNANIYNISCYQGESNNIILATNFHFVYDGKKLMY